MLTVLALIGAFTVGFFCGLTGGRQEAKELLHIKDETLEMYKQGYDAMSDSYRDMLTALNIQEDKDRIGATLQ